MTSKPSVLITGASAGIGAVYADRFAKRGHDLVLVARNQARLAILADRLRRETPVTVEILPVYATTLASASWSTTPVTASPAVLWTKARTRWQRSSGSTRRR